MTKITRCQFNYSPIRSQFIRELSDSSSSANFRGRRQIEIEEFLRIIFREKAKRNIFVDNFSK